MVLDGEMEFVTFKKLQSIRFWYKFYNDNVNWLQVVSNFGLPTIEKIEKMKINYKGRDENYITWCYWFWDFYHGKCDCRVK